MKVYEFVTLDGQKHRLDTAPIELLHLAWRCVVEGWAFNLDQESGEDRDAFIEQARIMIGAREMGL